MGITCLRLKILRISLDIRSDFSASVTSGYYLTNMDLLCYMSLAFVEEFKIEMNKGEGKNPFAFKTSLFRGGERFNKTIFKIKKASSMKKFKEGE